MSKYLLYLPLEKYLSQWATAALGNPIAFPHGSNENAVIRTYLRKLPEGSLPDVPDDSMTAVVIPDSVAKPAETYNYMGPVGKAAVRECLKDLFTRALWSDIEPISASSVGLNKLISAWCECHGIDLDQSETVRQLFYRIRKRYGDKGVNLRDCSRKKNL